MLGKHSRYGQWMISGRETNSGADVTVWYTGIRENKNYIASLFFGSAYSEQYLGRCSLLQVFNTRGKKGTYQFIVKESIAALRPVFGKRGYFFIPGWVSGDITLPSDVTRIINNRSTHSVYNRMKQNGMDFVLSRDESLFRLFYFKMYVPYIRSRHGDACFINGYRLVKTWFKEGVLILIKQRGEYVAGTVVFSRDSVGCLCLLGVKDSDADLFNQGVIGAVYYYALKYLHHTGCRRVDAGLSRAFLNDGVLRYKRNWGIAITGSSPGGFYMKAMDDSAGVRGFLHGNPFIRSHQGEKQAVFFNDSAVIKDEKLKYIKKEQLFNGLERIVINRLKDGGAIETITALPLTNGIMKRGDSPTAASLR
jgi:hypothetical protein